MHVSEETAEKTGSVYLQLTFAFNGVATEREQPHILSQLGPEGVFRSIFPHREPADGGAALAAHSISSCPALFDEIAWRYTFLVREEALLKLPPDPALLLEKMWEKYKSQWPLGFALCTVYFSNDWLPGGYNFVGVLTSEKWELLSSEKRPSDEAEFDHEDFVSAIEVLHDLSTHISPNVWVQRAVDIRRIMVESVSEEGASPGQIMQSIARNLTKMFQPEGDNK